MEVAIPVNPPEFDFNASAYANAPSTPTFTDYCSAPTSPTRIPDEFDDLFIAEEANESYSLATVPFAWEVKPGVPKSSNNFFDHQDFAFDISGELKRDSSVSAEVLFHRGVIKPVERGRERINNTSSLPSSRSRRTRSLPPVRGLEQPVATTKTTTSTTCTTLSISGSGKGSKKWSFMDLFLFRSASDGRAMDRDPLKKYSSIFRKHDEDFRSRDGSGSGSGSRRRGPVSAHELHYTVNRAVSNDMKKKSFLPYKQGILGRLAFNPTADALSNGFGYSHNNNN